MLKSIKHFFKASTLISLQKAAVKYKKINTLDIPYALVIGQDQWDANNVKQIFIDTNGNYFVVYQSRYDIKTQYYDKLANSLAFN